MHKIITTSTLALCLAGFTAALAPAPAHAAPSAPSGLRALVAAGQLEGQININTATEKDWELLPGVGPAIAKKLVQYRANKPFADVTHVMRVKGIGQKTFAQIKPYLSLKGETTLRKVP